MISKKHFMAGLYCLLCVFIMATVAEAGNKTFPAGSIIIPMDPCWQPNKECFYTPGSAATYLVNTTRCPEYKNYAYYKVSGTAYNTQCDSDLNDQGIFQSIGFLYDILKLGVPVSWVINPNKEVGVDGAYSAPDTADTKGRHAIDFSISMSGAAAAVQIKNSLALTTSGTSTVVNYRGGPFVIDINDVLSLETGTKAQFYTYLENEYPAMKYHVSNYDFTVPVDKVMSGVPPKVAVLGEGSTEILLAYLKASGLGSRIYDIFSTITYPEIINGSLDEFQLLWAPHWVIDDGCGEMCSTSGSCPSGYTVNTTQCSTWPSTCYKAATAESCANVTCGNNRVVDTSKCPPATYGDKICYKSSGTQCATATCSSGSLDTTYCSASNPKFCKVPGAPKSCKSPNCSKGVVDATQCSGDSAQSPIGQNICYNSAWLTGCKISQTDQDATMDNIRRFLEKGNAGFFECASVNSMEGAREYDGSVIDGTTSPTDGGFLTKQSYAAPRLDMNGGLCDDISSCDQTKIKYEGVTSPLNQCAGWSHVPTNGRLDNFRPLLTPSPDYAFNSTVTRFIHDTDTITYGSGREPAPPAYDYFVGGRINGSSTQGYVAYLAGHKYLVCTNTAVVTPSERILDVGFSCDINDEQLKNPNIVTIEAVLNTPNPPNYPALTGSCSCVAGSTCPKLSVNLANLVDAVSPQVCGVYISAEGATYNNTTKTLMNVKIGSMQPYGSGSTKATAADMNIKNIVVTFPTGTSYNSSVDIATRCTTTPTLASIADLTDPLGCAMCSTTAVSPATCDPTKQIVFDAMGDPSCSSTTDMTLGPLVTSCDVNWGSSTTCGTKYVLNTLVGLQFQLIPHEYNKAGAIQQDNILYKAAFEYPGYKGHLYSIDVKKKPAVTNWDAGKSATMPHAGTGSYPLAPAKNLANRYIFTNKAGTRTKINFDVNSAGSVTSTDPDKLWYYLDPEKTKSLNSIKALINSVRGRKNASDILIDGTAELSKRLGGIEHSSPAVMPKSSIAGAPNRDRVVFVGADDGMLHAFYAGYWDATLNAGQGGYTVGTGKEIWAYIPPTLLGTLQNQTFTDCNPGDIVTDICDPETDPLQCKCPIFGVAAAVDGSPALGDFYVDHDNNPSTPKQYRTILVATGLVSVPSITAASIKNQGIVFSLDVTDPYNPLVLWERTYYAPVDMSVAPGNDIKRNYYPSTAAPFTSPSTLIADEATTFKPNMGYAKGTAIGRVQVGSTLDTYVFVTSNWIEPVSGATGINVYALDFYSGDIKWETKLAYTGGATGINEAPPTPALMDDGDNGTYDFLVVGDSQGRLWVLKTIDGKTINAAGAPAFDVGNDTNEPIGAPVAVSGNTIVFATGGRDSLADETTLHHVYAIQIDNKGVVTNLWSGPYVLGLGEKVWSAPVIDANGIVYIATAIGYTDTYSADQLSNTSGRFMMLDVKTGTLATDSHGTTILPLVLESAVIGQIAVESGHVTLQLFNGTTIQIGQEDESSFSSSGTAGNPVRVLWWRKL